MADYTTKKRRILTNIFPIDNFNEIHHNYDNDKKLAETSKDLERKTKSIAKRSSLATCFDGNPSFISMQLVDEPRHKHQKVDFENSIYQNNRKLVKIKF